MKIITVSRCSTEECPFCIPHAYNKAINYCGAFVNQQPEINANIKTFPILCPLEDKNDKLGYCSRNN